MSKIIYCIPDLHLPWTDWDKIKHLADVIKTARKNKSNTVSVIQLGDLIDELRWSRYDKGPDAPNAQAEWDMVEDAVHTLHGLIPNMKILTGNHDLRRIKRAMQAELPRQMIKSMADMFPFKDWKWHISNELYQEDGIRFAHGDEFPISPSNSGLAASRIGQSIVFGHTHQASIQYVNIFDKQYFALNAGCIIDESAICFNYAAKNPKRNWIGYGVILDGVPHLVPLK